MKSGDADDVHESDEELRFFSSEPDHELDQASNAAPSLSPTTSPALHAPESGLEVSRHDARRAKLQRHVVATLGAAGVLLLLAFGAHERALHEQQPQNAALPARPAAAAPVSPPVAPLIVPAPAPLLASAVAEVAPASPTLPVASAVAEVAPASPTPLVANIEAQQAGASAVAVQQDSAALIQKARALLRAGHSREGVVAARDAVVQAPLEAEPYVLLGAGLQDLGDFGQARRVFAECLRLATHGPAATCRYFASR